MSTKKPWYRKTWVWVVVGVVLLVGYLGRDNTEVATPVVVVDDPVVAEETAEEETLAAVSDAVDDPIERFRASISVLLAGASGFTEARNVEEKDDACFQVSTGVFDSVDILGFMHLFDGDMYILAMRLIGVNAGATALDWFPSNHEFYVATSEGNIVVLRPEGDTTGRVVLSREQVDEFLASDYLVIRYSSPRYEMKNAFGEVRQVWGDGEVRDYVLRPSLLSQLREGFGNTCLR